MRLDRFAKPGQKGKFSIIANATGEVFDNGDLKKDFFVILLKDKHGAAALEAYAKSAEEDGDHELAADVLALADVSRKHPDRRAPD